MKELNLLAVVWRTWKHWLSETANLPMQGLQRWPQQQCLFTARYATRLKICWILQTLNYWQYNIILINVLDMVTALTKNEAWQRRKQSLQKLPSQILYFWVRSYFVSLKQFLQFIFRRVNQVVLKYFTMCRFCSCLIQNPICVALKSFTNISFFPLNICSV